MFQVSIDGTTFTADGTRFKYYRTPEMTQVTPNTCRRPFPRLRLDGKHIEPSNALMVRFEEETGNKQTGGEEGHAPLENNKVPVLPQPSRVFVVPGQTESEIIEVGVDPETELPIHRERWFITCDSPSLSPQAKFPFISRVTIAPNGATFMGEPLRFVAHDSHADLCMPTVVPIPNPVPVNGAKESDGTGALMRITGRNLYRGTGLAARLRFGGDNQSVISLDEVAFDEASASITGVLPAATGGLVAGAAGVSTTQPPSCPPAIGVVVEVSVDGHEYFAVPERLTLYRNPLLTLEGDGLYPAAEGGWAELVTAVPAFRGHEAKVKTTTSWRCRECRIFRG